MLLFSNFNTRVCVCLDPGQLWLNSAPSRDSGSGSGSLSPLCDVIFMKLSPVPLQLQSAEQNRTLRSGPAHCCSQADQQEGRDITFLISELWASPDQNRTWW